MTNPDPIDENFDMPMKHTRHPERDHAAEHDGLSALSQEDMQASDTEPGFDKEATKVVPDVLFHSECDILVGMRKDYQQLRDDVTGWASKAALPAATSIAALSTRKWRVAAVAASVAAYAGIQIAASLVKMRLMRHEMWSHARLDSQEVYQRMHLRKMKVFGSMTELPPEMQQMFDQNFHQQNDDEG